MALNEKAEKYLTSKKIVRAADIKKVKEAVNRGELDPRTNVVRHLLVTGKISEVQYMEAMTAEYGIESIDLSAVDINRHMKEQISKNIAVSNRIFPIEADERTIKIAVDDPANYAGIDAARDATKKKVTAYLTSSSMLDQAIYELYGNERADDAIESMSEIAEMLGRTETELTDVGNAENDANASAAERLVNTILERAVTDRASDIHFEVYPDAAIVRFRVDGILRDELTYDPVLHPMVIARLKVIGHMDVTQTRKAQDGGYSFQLNGLPVDLRMNSMKATFGEKMVCRVLIKSESLLNRHALGLSDEDLQKYDRLVDNHHGVILMVGPTGSGKSSTMYSMLKVLNKPDVNIITLENPVEYSIDRVTQIQIDDKYGISFADGLRSAMRQDPDIICIGEIRDSETADIAMRAAITGHLVISTLHTNSALSTFERLIDMGVEPYIIKSALLGIVSQRLVRKICPNCREEYTPDPEELELIGNPEILKGKKLYRGKGCSFCNHTGYKGRTGVFEILVLDRKIKDAIAAGASEEDLLKIAKDLDDEKKAKEGKAGEAGTGNSRFVTLGENLARLIAEGVTTTEEARKVTNRVE